MTTRPLSSCERRHYCIHLFKLTRSYSIISLIAIAPLLLTTAAPQQSKTPHLNNYGGKVRNVPMQTEHGLMMVQHWIDQAMGSFMSAMANNRLKSKSKHVALEFGDCSHNAKSVPEQARCLSKLLKDQISGKKYLKRAAESKYLESDRLKLYAPKNNSLSRRGRAVKHSWIGGFRLEKFKKAKVRGKRQIVRSRKSYELMSSDSGRMTPLGSVAHMLMKAVLAAKNKTETRPWQEIVQKIRSSSLKRKEIRKKLEEESIENMDQFAFRGMKNRGMVGEDLHSIVEDPKKLEKFLNKKRGQTAKEPMQKLMGLMKEGLKIGWTLAGKNTTNFADKNMKLASPRFLSVVPEEEDGDNNIDVLSPSLLSLHNEGKGVENLTSLPSLLNGFGKKDQLAWMNLIMEAAGVVEEADKIEEELKEMTCSKKDQFFKRYEVEARAKDGTPLYFTKENITRMFGKFEERKIDTHQAVMASLSKQQVKEMNKTGYAILNDTQLYMLYGPESPYNNSKVLRHLASLNSSSIAEHIERDIHQTAQLKSFNVRMKDIVLSPITLTNIVLMPGTTSQSIVLSPLLLSPVILSPSVLGPLVLSPALFVPIVLSPRVLSPLILTPLAFVPFILSPVVLHPVILSPGIFVPIILSPAVLTPFILSPQVFTPSRRMSPLPPLRKLSVSWHSLQMVNTIKQDMELRVEIKASQERCFTTSAVFFVQNKEISSFEQALELVEYICSKTNLITSLKMNVEVPNTELAEAVLKKVLEGKNVQLHEIRIKRRYVGQEFYVLIDLIRAHSSTLRVIRKLGLSEAIRAFNSDTHLEHCSLINFDLVENGEMESELLNEKTNFAMRKLATLGATFDHLSYTTYAGFNITKYPAIRMLRMCEVQSLRVMQQKGVVISDPAAIRPLLPKLTSIELVGCMEVTSKCLGALFPNLKSFQVEKQDLIHQLLLTTGLKYNFSSRRQSISQ